MNHYQTIDGNEAAAYVAYKTNEICAIYPITPASPMGEIADQWATDGKVNIWGNVPQITEMQSEAGVGGTVHGALQTGALTTTFTASQGLLLMIPNMYKIAGELTPCVIHVAARSLACQALSIFGDHSDVMTARMTGFALLCASSVQEAHDMALIAQAATLKGRVPFIHFFDGFRTSHEINKVTLLTDEQIRGMIDNDGVLAHRNRGLSPDNPFIRGTSQNPDVYFQARESVNRYYSNLPRIVQETMDRFSELTGREYRLFDYYGDPHADRVIVLMGSGCETVRETVQFLMDKGDTVGLLQCRLYRPFAGKLFLESLPPTCKSIAVLDRTKEPGAVGDPLYLDVVTSLAEYSDSDSFPLNGMPQISGGRYGLGSKEFTPAMVMAIFNDLENERPKKHFTIGIHDDVTGNSLEYDQDCDIEPHDVVRSMFFGLGSDGTVGANKNSIKIIGDKTDFYTQAYFVYDSKKSGSRTISHLRISPRPIRSTYLIQSANFIGCHQFNLLKKFDILDNATDGASVLLNAPYAADELWDQLPVTAQRQVVEKKLKLHVIDAIKIAEGNGLGNRINTIMQTCFFAITRIIPEDIAINAIKSSIQKAYGKKGGEIVQRNLRAVDQAVDRMFPVAVPAKATGREIPEPIVPETAPEFVRNVTAIMMAEKGNELPVSAFPADGTYPSGTSAWEKRNISIYAPVWEQEICIQCGNCSLVCPHSVIRSKIFTDAELENAPASFKSVPLSGRGFPDQRYVLQVYMEDCTGCALCIDVCPAKSKEASGVKAINMKPIAPILDDERKNVAFFESLPECDRSRIDFSTVRGVQYLQPLFEFCGACAGCGETPYLKLLTQLFGDRLLIANATGCSSIYGGNLPTTPWTTNKEGRGPAWSNSLFEDNAEFGFGFRLAVDKHEQVARNLLKELAKKIGVDVVSGILTSSQKTETEIIAQRSRITDLKNRLAAMDDPKAANLLSLVDHLVRRSVWIIGGDGWAYDIGFGGLDHVLASGRNINILVLDTEVYSNTGGQASKATPLGAVAKFAAGGKQTSKKDLALTAIAYGNVYVAKIAMGANPQQTILAFREAEAYPGPSLVIAYSHCIAHGINMQDGMRQQKLATESGYWPLFRFNPELIETGENSLELDSPSPKIPLQDYAYNEMRYKMLTYSKPREAKRLMKLAQKQVDQRWDFYTKMASTKTAESAAKGFNLRKTKQDPQAEKRA